MGIASCLCYLLEQYDDIRVYRCFAKIDAAGAGDEITTSDYQFAVDDWELEGLSDNVQIAGKLEYIGNKWQLELSVDDSFLEQGEPTAHLFAFGSLAKLLNALPDIAEAISSGLDVVVDQQAVVAYSPTVTDDARLEDLVTQVFDWNLDVYLHLWGVEWAERDITEQFERIADRSRQIDSDFPLWCLGMVAKQALQRGLEPVAEAVLPQLLQCFPSDLRAAPGVAAAASGLAELDYVDLAINLLEPYLQAGKPGQCLDQHDPDSPRRR